ncbi:hypothetical protein M407DRAFT_241741 [Tulasnella calospora MUT 4182]|uniref:Uncharacterized protein n=1 Tax=Tulasnella calospora MUT 4182 TaxID=1051891 RepID=A0A0C3LCL7_9AGAM|nr:hypothetical protein M407DRAFT_241741 [Tulasnella calospora MUT 4182]
MPSRQRLQLDRITKEARPKPDVNQPTLLESLGAPSSFKINRACSSLPLDLVASMTKCRERNHLWRNRRVALMGCEY